MSKQVVSTAMISFVMLMACNSNEPKNEHEGHNMKDSTPQSVVVDDTDLKTAAVVYTDLNATAAASIKLIVDHYLHIKNALVNDNGDEAANGGEAMIDAIKKVDKSLFTTDQKKAYDEITSELQDHGEHVAKNASDIKHQRSHFILMSEDMYSLVKTFGAGRPVYHDHCPMANDNKGAMWISEIKEVKNPYFGAKMLTCGSVEEVIK
ncbi:DUF3347 domain-containing protein [Lacibacter sp. H375]|uniref:DUF3347 domain-containing protein n=1 Tax=Lacibacter sp. H375 TaxID=3133424 RepID=UPI0030C13B9C